MAGFVMSGFDAYAAKLEKHGDEVRLHAVSDDMLTAAAPILEGQMRANLRAVIGKDTTYRSRSTGELLSALGTTKPGTRKSDGSRNVRIGFYEPRKKQPRNTGKKRPVNKFQRIPGRVSYYVLTNAMIANVLEYGKYTRYVDSGGVSRPIQPPKPWLRPAFLFRRKDALEKMQDIYSEHLRKEGIS